MSWDVVIFNLSRKIDKAEDIDENVLVNIGTGADFKNIIVKEFPYATFEDNWCKIETDSFSLETSLCDPNEELSNTIFHLYGENAIYALVNLCKKQNWQAFDTSLGTMLNLDKPEENGYSKFQEYLTQVLKDSN